MNAGTWRCLRRKSTHCRVEVVEHALALGGAHGALDQLLVRRAVVVEGTLPHLARVAELIPVGRAQAGRVVRPEPAAVLEVDGPAPVEVAVHRRLRVDRDVLVHRGAALLRRVPLERALGLLPATAGPVAERLCRWSCSSLHLLPP